MGGIVITFKAIGWEGHFTSREYLKSDLHIPDCLLLAI